MKATWIKQKTKGKERFLWMAWKWFAGWWFWLTFCHDKQIRMFICFISSTTCHYHVAAAKSGTNHQHNWHGSVQPGIRLLALPEQITLIVSTDVHAGTRFFFCLVVWKPPQHNSTYSYFSVLKYMFFMIFMVKHQNMTSPGFDSYVSSHSQPFPRHILWLLPRRLPHRWGEKWVLGLVWLVVQ